MTTLDKDAQAVVDQIAAGHAANPYAPTPRCKPQQPTTMERIK